MNGTLALVGGAEWTEGCSFDAALVADTDEVLILPSALAYENPGLALARAEAWFGALGKTIRVLDVYRRADARAIDPAIAAEARCIYVPSGSPMHLRSVLKDTPLLDAMVTAWRNGATVAAAAEAAAVLCSHMVDLRGGAFTVGLDLITTMTVIPRSNVWSHDKWHRTVQLAPRSLPLVGVDEATALLHHPDGTWEIQGVGGIRVVIDGQTGDVTNLPASLNPVLDS